MHDEPNKQTLKKKKTVYSITIAVDRNKNQNASVHKEDKNSSDWYILYLTFKLSIYILCVLTYRRVKTI